MLQEVDFSRFGINNIGQIYESIDTKKKLLLLLLVNYTEFLKVFSHKLHTSSTAFICVNL